VCRAGSSHVPPTCARAPKVRIHHTQKHSSDELLREAEAHLRCIDWKDISLDLLLHSVRDVSAKQNNYFRSRPLAKGEKIDFFISHSWSDDARAKFEVLKGVAANFFQSHGR